MAQTPAAHRVPQTLWLIRFAANGRPEALLRGSQVLLFGTPLALKDAKGARIFLLALGLGTVVVFLFEGLYVRWRDRRDIQTLRYDVSAALVEETQIELTRIVAVRSHFDLHYVMEVGTDELAFLPNSWVRDLGEGACEEVDLHPRESIKVVRAPQNGGILAIQSHGKSIAPSAIYEIVKDDRPGKRRGLPLHDYRPFPGRLEQLLAIFNERGITMRLAKEQSHS